MKRYSHDNWNQVLLLPEGPTKDHDLRNIGHMSIGNLVSFVRRLVVKPNDRAIDYWQREGRLSKRSQFLDYMDRL